MSVISGISKYGQFIAIKVGYRQNTGATDFSTFNFIALIMRENYVLKLLFGWFQNGINSETIEIKPHLMLLKFY